MEILSEFGFQVDRAEDGVICINMLLKAAPDYYAAILTDIQMPNLDGYEMTRKIRALNAPKRNNIPIIAMTANAFEEDRLKALASGMNGHVTKPINVGKLIEVLSFLLK